jgi:phage-related protein
LHFYADIDILCRVQPKKPTSPPIKPMPTVGSGAYEIRVRDASGACRAIHVAKVRYKMIGAKP